MREAGRECWVSLVVIFQSESKLFVIVCNFIAVTIVSRFTRRRPSPLLLISTSTTLAPLPHNPPPFVLLLLSLTFTLFWPVQSRLLCGPSVSHPLNAIFIQATVSCALHTLIRTSSPTLNCVIYFNWNIRLSLARNWLHPISHCINSLLSRFCRGTKFVSEKFHIIIFVSTQFPPFDCESRSILSCTSSIGRPMHSPLFSNHLINRKIFRIHINSNWKLLIERNWFFPRELINFMQILVSSCFSYRVPNAVTWNCLKFG